MYIFLMVAVFLLAIAAATFIFRLSKNKPYTKKLLLVILSALVGVLGAELTIFNVNFYATRGYEEIPLERYLSPYLTEDGIYEITSAENTLVFNELYAEIKNIKLDMVYDSTSSVQVEIKLTDDGNEYLFTTPRRSVNPGVKKSQVINVHTKGITKTATVSFLTEGTNKVHLNGISINTERDFEFSFSRVFILMIISLFIFAFKPSSPLYKSRLNENADLAKSLSTSIIIVESAVIIILASINPTFMGIASKNYNSYALSGSGIDLISLPLENHNQYDQLAQAILDGKTYIDNNDVPEFLKEMENPYDTNARSVAGALFGESARWDVAYYNGHYYVYFGIVPLLLMYLPFRALFNAPFPTAIGIAAFCILFCIGSYLLLSFTAKKKFKNISVGSFLLIFLIFINSSGMLFYAKRPDFYSLPIIVALTFSVFGIFFWLKALESTRRQLPLFFLGSLFMALVAGSRPQTAFLSLIALPIFWRYFFNEEKTILKKNGLISLGTLAAPYIAIAAGLMYYNYIRFNSPFDFGANYNLTTNDMTARGFDFGRLGLGLFTYLFQPPSFSAVFPFIKPVSIVSNYVGKTVYENCFGGAFATIPLLWSVLLLPKVKNLLKEKKLFAFAVLPLIIAVAVVITDTQGAGLLQRYFGDFTFMLLLSASITVFALYEKYTDKALQKALNTALFSAAIISAVYCFCLVLSLSDITIDTQNPELYTYISETVQFWL